MMAFVSLSVGRDAMPRRGGWIEECGAVAASFSLSSFFPHSGKQKPSSSPSARPAVKQELSPSAPPPPPPPPPPLTTPPAPLPPITCSPAAQAPPPPINVLPPPSPPPPPSDSSAGSNLPTILEDEHSIKRMDENK